MRYLNPEQLRELSQITERISKSGEAASARPLYDQHQQDIERLLQLVSEIESQEAEDCFDLLREARAKIDVASGIVDWTKEDVEDSGEDFFDQDLSERIGELLKRA